MSATTIPDWFESSMQQLWAFLRGNSEIIPEDALRLMHGIKDRDVDSIFEFMATIPHTSLILAWPDLPGRKFRLVPKFQRHQLPAFTHKRRRYVLIDDDGLGFGTYFSRESFVDIFKTVRKGNLPFYLCLNDMMYHPEDFFNQKKGKDT